MQESSPQFFGKYEIQQRLGAGGMGEVLLASQPLACGINRQVVIKKVLPHLAQDPDFVRRFLDETRLASSLSHGNIVQVYESGELDGSYYMVMEYVDGPDLRAVLAQQRPLPHVLVAHILIEICKALTYAHEKLDSQKKPMGLIHRDISPANILLGHDGQVKLTDFGVAKASARMSHSLPGTLHGKVFYVSPEQIEGKPADTRSDLFSLGVVAYEMLSGRRPFDGESELMVIEQVRRCEPVPLSQLALDVSGELVTVVNKAIQKNPEQRYSSAAEMQQDLTRILYQQDEGIPLSHRMAHFLEEAGPFAVSRHGEESGDMAPRASALDLSPSPSWPGGMQTRSVVQPPRQRPKLWVFVLVALGILALLAGLWFQSPRRPFSDGQMALLPVVTPIEDVVVIDEPDLQQGSDGAEDLKNDAALDAQEHSLDIEDSALSPKPSTDISSEKILLQSEPKGVHVRVGKRILGQTPLEIPRPQQWMRLEFFKEGFATRSIRVGPESKSPLFATLLSKVTGRVQFRFFPADSLIWIDGENVDVSGNRVDMELEAGAHRLELRSKDGRVGPHREFVIIPKEAVSLGTLEWVQENKDD